MGNLSLNASVTVVLIVAAAATITAFGVIFYAKRRGHDVYSRKFAYLVCLGMCVVFFLPLVWIMRLSIELKVTASFLMILVVIGRNVMIDQISGFLKRALGRDKGDNNGNGL